MTKLEATWLVGTGVVGVVCAALGGVLGTHLVNSDSLWQNHCDDGRVGERALPRARVCSESAPPGAAPPATTAPA